MPFNLMNEPWLPVVRLNGDADAIAPHQITSGFDGDPTNPVLALDFPRPDWNAAVTEWLIGIVSVAFPPKSPNQWAELWRTPPTTERLQEAFSTIAFAFDLDDEGPRCFQDRDPLAETDDTPITQLLIDFPGENAIKRNTDLFIKRACFALTKAEAAAALITLQTYAPGGGAGHRTSMRGGGPFTTLVAPRRVVPEHPTPVVTLWDLVWTNAKDGPPLPVEKNDPEWAGVFPWLGATATSEKGQVFTPELAHPHHAFFGVPRRIRLRFDEAGMVSVYATKPWGVNYNGWEHPLSPYYKSPTGAYLPLHARVGPPSWRDWPSLWCLTPDDRVKRAATVQNFVDDRSDLLPMKSAAQPDLRAFGYDMDKMKALRWVSFTAPWLPGLKAANAADRAALIAKLIKAGEDAASACRMAVRLSLYGEGKEGRYTMPDTVKPNAGVDPAPEFWANTEAAFRAALTGFDEAGGDPEQKVRLQFAQALKREAKAIFDRYADPETFADGDPERTLQALATLLAAFAPWGKVAAAMDVAIAKPPKPRKAAR